MLASHALRWYHEAKSAGREHVLYTGDATLSRACSFVCSGYVGCMPCCVKHIAFDPSNYFVHKDQLSSGLQLVSGVPASRSQ